MKMLKLTSLLFIALSLSGCMTKYAKLPISRSAIHAIPTNKTIGLAQVKDTRADEKIGYVAMLDIGVGGDLKEYVEILVKQKLSKQGFNTTTAPSLDELQSSAVNNRANGTNLMITVKNVSFSTFDALLAPVDTSCDLQAHVYDAQGKVIYQSNYTGHDNSQRLGFSGPSGESEGDILKVAIDNAVTQMLNDTSLKNALSAQVSPSPTNTQPTAEQQLNQLKQLKDKGVISNKEYESKRKTIIDGL